MMMTDLGRKARSAARSLAVTDSEKRNSALLQIASALEAETDKILAANALDMAAAEQAGMSAAMQDRLRLDASRIAGMAAGVRDVAAQPDPLGRILDETVRPNGLKIVKTCVPIGVIAVIFEARPNVTSDCAALCLKAGNATILRGGREAINSNTAITCIMQDALEKAGLPRETVQLVEDTSRESARELMTMNGYVDLLIPRGGSGLIRTVVENATVPVIETGAGTCHTYVDRAADIGMAVDIIYNAKVSRPSVCNACECMLIHKDIAAEALPEIVKKLRERSVEVRGDEVSRAILGDMAVEAGESDWGMEYHDYIIACRVVDSIEDAMEHIFRFGTGHSECIVTSDADAAAQFMAGVDAAAVYWNASTRFTDGGEFGLGAEIGISTQKLHARGPLGAAELTSMKYLVYGSGQVR